MISLLDLNADEIILVSFLIAQMIARDYTCEEVGVLSTFVRNLDTQLATMAIKGIYNRTRCNTESSSEATSLGDYI